MLNGNGALDTSAHRLVERVREEFALDRLSNVADAMAEPPTEELQANGGSQPPAPDDAG